jgi:hypothetical protein
MKTIVRWKSVVWHRTRDMPRNTIILHILSAGLAITFAPIRLLYDRPKTVARIKNVTGPPYLHAHSRVETPAADRGWRQWTHAAREDAREISVNRLPACENFRCRKHVFVFRWLNAYSHIHAVLSTDFQLGALRRRQFKTSNLQTWICRSTNCPGVRLSFVFVIIIAEYPQSICRIMLELRSSS